MNLTFEQIKSITQGAVRFAEVDGGLMPCRFTEAQERAYEGYSADFYKKTFASAGIRLEMLTDSKSISMEVELTPASSRSYACFDIYANGALLKNCRCSVNGDRTKATVCSELPESKKPLEVTVYFPWSASTVIGSVTLEDGASVEPIKRPLTMINFGDSITHGYDCTNPSFSYASRLTDALHAEAVNKGIGGEIFYPTLASLKDDLDPDIITVAYGTNDWSHSTKVAFDRDAKEFYEILSKNYPKAKIFAISPLWRHNMDSTEKDVGPFSYVYDYLAKVTADLPNVTLINGLELVPHEWRCFPGDGLHPNDEGFRHYANNLYAEIKKYL
ncbi:MAG: SGNH/GDSL hydrolase family protein [Clostridia bacterium]|nr:SGNH/GDSL hydrolase family protein [Clostridia bacterium]